MQHVLAYRRRKKARIFSRDRWRCTYCGEELTEQTATIDHRVPISRGGPDTDRNKTTCCMTCNKRKFRKTVAEFIRQLEAERGGTPSWVTSDNPLALEDEEAVLVV